VIVPTRDRPEMLEGCLRSLKEDLRDHDEVIVVDSCSVGAGTAGVAEAEGARCVRAAIKGASVARNLGWRVAAHDLVAFVDDDVRVSDGWADAMVAALERPGVGFVTGRVGTPSGQEDVVRKVAQLDADQPRRIDASDVGIIGHSANLGAHRAVLAGVGGFDERLGPGHPFVAEDYDLFDRLLLAGVIGRYEPDARAYHEQWRGRGERLVLDWHYGLGSGARLSKLARLDSTRAVGVARHVLGGWVIAGLWQDLKAGSRLGPVHAGVLMAGMLCGFAACLAIPLECGHLSAVRASPDA
jgi:glycosyltransferase involved in cell wall biosynthesis